jgi:hypothetical protein
MLNLIEIIENNRKTFYCYRTGKASSQALANILKMLAAGCLTALFYVFSESLAGAIITVYAILVGFSFNILFYLAASNEKIPEITNSTEDAVFFEDQIQEYKMRTLSGELFHNVSYFNLVSIALIMMCLGIYFSNCQSIFSIFTIQLDNISPLWEDAKIGFKIIYISLLFLLLIESGYTFLRIIDRVNFYFNGKIKNPSVQ